MMRAGPILEAPAAALAAFLVALSFERGLTRRLGLDLRELEQSGHIGGDFYDFVDRGRSLLIPLADVSGKGIPAALVMEASRTLFRLLACETDRPEQLVARLGRAPFQEHGGTPYVTCFLARLDLDHRSLAWVSAGHPAALLVTGTEHRMLAATGPPAGILPELLYDAQELRLAGGERSCW